MNVLQIGSFAILVKWVLLGLAFVIGIVFMKIWLNRSLKKDLSKKIFDLLSNGIFIFFLVWKGSLILLEPKLIIKSPFSLLYFTGGEKGLVVAILITILYFIYHARKLISRTMMIRILIIFGLIVTGSYHFLYLFFQEENELLHLIVGSLASILFYLMLRWKVRRGF
ncbi:hypothetical protein [Neobacillus sp. D3-1R]|uniref:hypothetical protein n=1 Tax=Neobacillus sp. D3-1R TaxID=3445778 RepID=UPI003FA02A38